MVWLLPLLNFKSKNGKEGRGGGQPLGGSPPLPQGILEEERFFYFFYFFKYFGSLQGPKTMRFPREYLNKLKKHWPCKVSWALRFH